ncbi:MAG: PAS domain S-box protein, partial [Syntrophorhabdaceae bacterium]|nr:PAS domain S-box protein [Syntrophorhabdaceae bacterium]
MGEGFSTGGEWIKGGLINFGLDSFKMLADSIADFIWVKDREGRFVLVNRAMNDRIFREKDISEVIGKTDAEIALPVRNAGCQHDFDKKCTESDLIIYETKTPRKFDQYGYFKDNFMHLEVYKTPIFGTENEIIGIVGHARDITRYVTAQRALEDSQRRLADIVNYLPDATMVIDRAGKVIAWNKSMEKFTGIRAEDIVGAGDYEYAIPFYGQRRPILVDLALNIGDKTIEEQYPSVAREGDTLLTELFVPTFGQRGAYIWAKAKPLYDISGDIVGAIETVRDITETRLGEEAIRQSAEKYRTLFEESLDVIFITTPGGNLIDINPAGVKLFGYDSKEEFLKVDIGNDLYLSEADRHFYRKTIEKEGHVNGFELTLKKKDGRKVTVSLNATAVFDEKGKIMAYRGTMRDITNLKLLEQQLLESQKMETLGRLAGGIAHDFNNILNIILGGAQLIKMKTTFDEKTNGYLSSIEKAVFRASDFVKQLLAFSRRQTLNFEVVSLNDIVADFTKMVNRVIGENIEMKIVPAANMTKINVDIAQVHQILLNLVVNARDSMAEGGTLTISTSSEIVDEEFCLAHVDAKPGSYAVLTVSDTGEGIDPETVKKIFEPFFTTKRSGGGTGLGLSVVYGIVKQHGGFVTVESKIGKGTIFGVY